MLPPGSRRLAPPADFRDPSGIRNRDDGIKSLKALWLARAAARRPAHAGHCSAGPEPRPRPGLADGAAGAAGRLNRTAPNSYTYTKSSQRVGWGQAPAAAPARRAPSSYTYTKSPQRMGWGGQAPTAPRRPHGFRLAGVPGPCGGGGGKAGAHGRRICGAMTGRRSLLAVQGDPRGAAGGAGRRALNAPRGRARAHDAGAVARLRRRTTVWRKPPAEPSAERKNRLVLRSTISWVCSSGRTGRMLFSCTCHSPST